MTKFEAEMLLNSTIVRVLTEYPDLAGLASQAIGAGVVAANTRLAEQLNRARTVVGLSLALLPPNRINDEARDLMAKTIANFISDIPPNGRCPAESAFLAMKQGSI
jgi:hypothetical protein